MQAVARTDSYNGRGADAIMQHLVLMPGAERASLCVSFGYRRTNWLIACGKVTGRRYSNWSSRKLDKVWKFEQATAKSEAFGRNPEIVQDIAWKKRSYEQCVEGGS